MIEGFIGPIGNGKTMLGVEYCVQLARRRGAVLLANIRIVPPPGLEFHQLSVGEDGIDTEEVKRYIMAAKGQGHGVVIYLDEIGIMMPARFWQSFPVDLMFIVSQSRKLAADLVFSAQDIEQVDSYMRRLTQWVFKVRAIPSPTVERREKGRRPWFFLVSKWRPASVEKRDARMGRQVIRYRRAWESQYDTDELVVPPPRLRKRGRKGEGAAPVLRDPEREVRPEDHLAGQDVDGLALADGARVL